MAVRELSPKPDTSPNPDKQEGGTDDHGPSHAN
jgi:hypothetical protein